MRSFPFNGNRYRGEKNITQNSETVSLCGVQWKVNPIALSEDDFQENAASCVSHFGHVRFNKVTPDTVKSISRLGARLLPPWTGNICRRSPRRVPARTARITEEHFVKLCCVPNWTQLLVMCRIVDGARGIRLRCQVMFDYEYQESKFKVTLNQSYFRRGLV